MSFQHTNALASMKIVYSRHYNISFFGIERLHPFDSRKYGRAWNHLRKQFGPALSSHHISVDRPASDEELRLVHTPEYLRSLRSSEHVAAALEIPLLRLLPGWLLAWRVLRPMRWAVRGSVIAAKAALQNGAAVNLSGGYHHAKPGQGEGFCVYSDIALMVQQLRHEQLLQPADAVLYVDLDAHQGNGVCHQFQSDRRVFIFDMYDKDIYPQHDLQARERIDCDLPLPFNCPGHEYLANLRRTLPPFLDALAKTNPRLAIYNAGTDVYAGDKLGGLCLSEDDVLERDLFVIQQFQRRGIPFVMVLSGGYSRHSYRLVANTVARLLQKEEFSSSDKLE
ncbi:MAG TPA: histone deacetylase [Verrucomicrobiae bacterium]|nr:histone deacetylase [Verrucomicrobiae bacterium]